ncbi:MAG: ABC transporter ATP-binding protein [Fidelibacterota bacterium]|nr:MAG: ABC transporter ATP-binding protein [Candidatus Neomarinimicrobiota bacterium]
MSDLAIATVDLSKRFGKRAALDHLDLEVPKGEIFGFLGPNGSGKTTTIRLLLSLIRPSTGDAFLFGQSIKRKYPHYLGQIGALVDEADFYLNLSALANLRLLARLQRGVDEARCREVLQIVGLLDRAHDRVKTYSHGMRQRLGIAQAILHRPQLLILDEPTTGLDPQGMHEVRQMIRQLANEEGMTIFLSSHLLHEVEQLCTSMAVLSEGKLLVSGPVDQFLSAETATLTELQATPIDKAKDVLESLPYVTEVVVLGQHLRFRVQHQRRPDITRTLAENGVEIYSLNPVSKLEDYFLSLFGFGELP